VLRHRKVAGFFRFRDWLVALLSRLLFFLQKGATVVPERGVEGKGSARTSSIKYHAGLSRPIVQLFAMPLADAG